MQNVFIAARAAVRLGDTLSMESQNDSVPAGGADIAAAYLQRTVSGEHPCNGFNMSVRRYLAIIGTLRYAAETLDMSLTRCMQALKTQIEAARIGTQTGFETRITVPRQAMTDVGHWASTAAVNTPVHVVRGRQPAADDRVKKTVEVYVDASAWGYGAIIIDGSSVRHLSVEWTEDDARQAAAQGGHLGSSVFAEPLALRKVMCSIDGRTMTGARTVVYSDHKSMTSLFEGEAGGARYSLTPSYNAAIELVADMRAAGFEVCVLFVPGANNPADPLSRGRPPQPRLLNVTSIGNVARG